MMFCLTWLNSIGNYGIQIVYVRISPIHLDSWSKALKDQSFLNWMFFSSLERTHKSSHGLSMINSGMFAQLCWASCGTNRIQLLMLQPLSCCTPKNTLENSGTRLFVCFSLFVSLNSRWQQRKPPSYKSNWLGWFYCTHLCIDNSFNFDMNITLEHGALTFLILMITNQL